MRDARQGQIELGAAVDALDGRLGTVDEILVHPETGELACLVVQRPWSGERLTVPAELIAAIPSRREVRLGVTRNQARDQARGAPPDAFLASDRGEELHIPVHEERLVAGTRPADLGELRVHKRVETVEETVRAEVTRDDLDVERIPVGRPLEAPVGPRTEGDWLIIPIMEEVLVVEKRLMLVEEVRIRRRQVSEERELTEPVRRERIDLEDATVYGVVGLRAAGATTRLDVAPPEPPDGDGQADVIPDDDPTQPLPPAPRAPGAPEEPDGPGA